MYFITKGKSMASKKKLTIPEKDASTILSNVPFPKDLSQLKKMTPIIIKQPYHIDYIHSYGQDSPFFAGLANKKLLGTKCSKCGYSYATPKLHCMECGAECEWIELPREGKIHTWTTCYFGSEEFLKETPFNLVLVEFNGINTLFLARLVGISQDKIRIGMKVRAKFRKNPKFKPTDVYFIPASDKE